MILRWLVAWVCAGALAACVSNPTPHPGAGDHRGDTAADPSSYSDTAAKDGVGQAADTTTPTSASDTTIAEQDGDTGPDANESEVSDAD